MNRLKLVIFICVVACAGMCARTPYGQLSGRAGRYFESREWPSANAMYLLMLEQQPGCASTYSHAIVSNIMAGDSVMAMEMLTRAMQHGVPVDTVLQGVQRVSFSLGNGELYKNYLYRVKEALPWYGRVIDNYLLEYYSFRRNGPRLVEYARVMLAGLPDDLRFLRLLARGQMLSGDTDAALGTWLKAARLYPDDYDTVLDIANCLVARGRVVEARPWLRRAYGMHPTPYVASLLAGAEAD